MSELEYKRIAANTKLIRIITLIAEKNPALRFSQIVMNFGFVTVNQGDDYDPRTVEYDPWVEPHVVLKRVIKYLKEISWDDIVNEVSE